jgi:hypothetical protein
MLKAAFISWMTDRFRRVTDRSRRVNVRWTFKGGDREVSGLAVRGHSREESAKRVGWLRTRFTVVPLYGINVRGALRRYLAAEPPTRLPNVFYCLMILFVKVPFIVSTLIM